MEFFNLQLTVDNFIEIALYHSVQDYRVVKRCPLTYGRVAQIVEKALYILILTSLLSVIMAL